MSRTSSLVSRTPRTLLLLGGLLLAFPGSVSAAEFQFVGDGFSQNLHWIWSWTNSSGVRSCLTEIFNPCGAVFATNGEIAFQGFGGTSSCLRTKGQLQWLAGTEGPPGQLTVFALNNIQLGNPLNHMSCNYNNDAWSSIDAREVPLEFIAVQGPGDPATLTLGVSVRLDGTIYQWTRAGSAIVTLQYMARVRVNGVEVVGDTLNTQVAIPDSTDLTWTAELPDGAAANHVMIPNLPWNTQISIMLWAYMRGETNASGTIGASSEYGEGPALVANVYAANAVAVEPETAPNPLSLSARPNPAPGPLRIDYVLPEASPMVLNVYDVTGSRVTKLADRSEPAGRGAVSWDGTDGRSRLAPGLYFIELVAGSRRSIARVALLGP